MYFLLIILEISSLQKKKKNITQDKSRNSNVINIIETL